MQCCSTSVVRLPYAQCVERVAHTGAKKRVHDSEGSRPRARRGRRRQPQPRTGWASSCVCTFCMYTTDRQRSPKGSSPSPGGFAPAQSSFQRAPLCQPGRAGLPGLLMGTLQAGGRAATNASTRASCRRHSALRLRATLRLCERALLTVLLTALPFTVQWSREGPAWLGPTGGLSLPARLSRALYAAATAAAAAAPAAGGVHLRYSSTLRSAKPP